VEGGRRAGGGGGRCEICHVFAALADAWCNVPSTCPIGLQNTTFYALNDTDPGGDSPQWRCYASSTLNPAHTHYVNGTAFCTRDQQLTQLLSNCAAGVITAPTPVFLHGESSSNINATYPCIRIPSVISLPTSPPSLAAFAECRYWVGDGCIPIGSKERTAEEGFVDVRDLCMKTSVDGGMTWGALETIVQCGEQPGPVVYSSGGRVWVNMQFNRCSVMNSTNAQVVGEVVGAGQIAWGAVESLAATLGVADGSDVGPGVSIQLAATNPYAPGRLLAVGHWGAYTHDYIWYSDDDGQTWTVANTSALNSMDEAQLAELANGTVVVNMRNNHLTACDCRASSSSSDGGKTWSAVSFVPALISPVCQASILRDSASPALFFANPASTSDRVNGTVRRSPDSGASWSDGFLLNSGAYAYSCLANVNDTTLGLLWETETNPTDCDGPSCALLFSLIPKDLP
jgi:sialidase-1